MRAPRFEVSPYEVTAGPGQHRGSCADWQMTNQQQLRSGDADAASRGDPTSRARRWTDADNVSSRTSIAPAGRFTGSATCCAHADALTALAD